MKKRISILLILCLFLTACAAEGDNLSNELGIDISAGKEVTSFDTHGGFHGDGMTHLVLEFPDDGLLNQLQANEEWKQLPLDETASLLVYGGVEVRNSYSTTRGPMLTDGEGNTLIPEIERGYYRLIDRHSQKGETDILERASYNFTLAIYDADTRMLYYCKFDT